MLAYAPWQIAGDAYVEHAVGFTCEYVDGGLFHNARAGVVGSGGYWGKADFCVTVVPHGFAYNLSRAGGKGIKEDSLPRLAQR